jgi:tRNA threonylcarbamoyl adenosine modification protein YeaZ
MTSSSDSTPHPLRALAIDTALGACSVAIVEQGRALPIVFDSEDMATGHAEALMPMVKRVMDEAEGGFSALSRIVVGVGPGSFTGLRVGISAARAFGLATGAPVVGVSTLAAYAAPLIDPNQAGVIAVAIDARHGAIYFQAFTSAGRTIVAPRFTGLKEASRLIGSGPVRLAGSGAAALAVEAMSLGLSVSIADMKPAPDIVWLARLGLAADPASAPAKPLYLRAPNAAPQEGKGVARR